MKKLTAFVINHIEITLILLISLLAFGLYSLKNLRSEFISDMSLPQIYIMTVYPGANPEDVEEDVSKVIENAVYSLADIKDVSSQSSANVSLVNITFNDGVNLDNKLSDVRHRISKVANDLPSGIQAMPDAFIADSSMVSVFSFSLASKDSAKLYSYLNDKIIPEINRIPGVSQINVLPDAEKKLIVKLDMNKLYEKDIPAIDVYKLINASSVSLPLGEADYMSRGGSVRYDGRFKSINDVKNLTVGVEDDIIIHLSDVADIYKGSVAEEDSIIVNGNFAYFVEIKKRSDGDIVGICKQIRNILDRVDKETQGELNISVTGDNSVSTKNTIRSVLVSGILGIIMAIIAIWVCLGDGKATLIIGLSIPLCILFTFILYSISGLTLNIMTLTGLVVSLGMIVDGSIVMLEGTYRYIKVPGFNVKKSILKSSDDVSSSIFASALTSIVVFIPMLFLKGIVGKILRDVSLTLIFALSSSAIVAIAAVPFFIKTMKKDGDGVKEHKLVDRTFARIESSYAKCIGWCLKHRAYVVITSILLLLASIFLASKLGFTFLNSVDQSEFYIELDFPRTYTKEQVLGIGVDVQNFLEENIDGIETCVQLHGKSFTSQTATGNNLLSYKMMLLPAKKRKMRIQEIIPQMQIELQKAYPDANVKITNGGFDYLLSMVSNGGGYQLTLYGEDFDDIYNYANNLKNSLSEHSDVASVSLSTTYDNRSIIFDMSTDFISSLGLTSYEAGMTSAIIFRENNVGQFTDEDSERYNIILKSNVLDKSLDRDILKNLKVKSLSGKMIDFSQIGKVKESYGISNINRKNKNRNISVVANLMTDDQSKVAKFVSEYIAEHPLPNDVRKESGGIMMLVSDSLVPLATVLAIAIFLVFVVMVIQFEHFFHPLIIMFSIPFCLIGVILGLLLFNTPVSIMTVLAVVSLAGTVVNNGIILIDYTNSMRYRLRECRDKNIDTLELSKPDSAVTGAEYRTVLLDKEFEGAMLKDTVIKAGGSRIKPILMTVSTTMFGVIPMAFDKSEGAELYAPLGQAMALGLLISTLITLFVIPTVYYMHERKIIKRKCKE